MREFWTRCGFDLLERKADGRLVVTDDYLRAYYLRPELMPVTESCANERALHDSLLEQPRREVTEAQIMTVADEVARENYRVMLRFRDRLLASPTVESFYVDLFRRDIAVPPPFIHHTVQVILRNILHGVEDGLQARAAELFFRTQRVSVKEGAIMLADQETVDTYASGGTFGEVGRLLVQARVPPRTIDLDVLNEQNSSEYWKRDERFDTVLNLGHGRPGSGALCRVLERWIRHFHGIQTTITPIREIPDEDWKWHVGLDAEATALLNAIYNGEEVEEECMRRVIGLFRIDFTDPSALRPELAGIPVFLGLAMAGDGILRVKPQNLLINLPLARRA